MSYSNCKIIGAGTSGFVYQARLLDVPEELKDIAIKKVLQNENLKNRELQIMRLLSHPNIVDLRAFFYSNGERDGVCLNLVLDRAPETLHSVSRHAIQWQLMRPLQLKLYTYQLFRSLAYIHSVGVCHRDIKPHNLLLDPSTGVLKLCDFGSAKILVEGESSVSYICTRPYRAPGLIFFSTSYTNSIDLWSAGCTLAELMLGRLLFDGVHGIDQLVEIIKVLGTPSREEVEAMNPHFMEHPFPYIKPQPLSKVFPPRTSPEAIDLVAKLFKFTPSARLSAVEAMVHPLFDELRVEGARMPDGKDFPPLFNFMREELSVRPDLIRQLVPHHAEQELRSRNIDLDTFVPIPLEDMKVSM